MSKRMYEDLKEILCHELNEITRKGDIDREGLDDVYKLSSAITMVESLMKKGQQGSEQSMEEYSNARGNSNRMMPMWAYEGNSNDSYGNMSNRGMSNERGTTDGRDGGRSRDYSRDSYENNDSYRRGRGADGRYVSRDSYDSYDSYDRGSYDSYDSYDSYERGYSRHTAEQKVAEQLKDMLKTTESPKVREAIEQAMMKIKR
jgi:hypothetical protein